MATLPTVPGPFTDGTAPTLTQLQQLSQAVSFISDCTTRPLWHLYQTSLVSLSTGWNGINFGSVAYDNDGVASGGGAVIVTQGYYAVEAAISTQDSASAFNLLVGFLFTAGGHNPHFTLGTQLRFGARGGSALADASANPAFTTADICPNVCYPGDTISVQVNTSLAINLNYNSDVNYIQGRFVSNFTGMWVSEGV